MREPTMEQKANMLNRAIDEAECHGVSIPVYVGDHISEAAKVVLGAFTEYGMDDLYDYWRGNFVTFGILA